MSQIYDFCEVGHKFSQISTCKFQIFAPVFYATSNLKT
ncbi:hypothetical protein CAMRE0001_0947 [Campylobacter rectus RM3267]|uniref:Uncharacterized protein n=1 Tax=Campylobacter rectus RM3267 TaxID=553218 RepID=B9D2L2_CAMRE|nr:hypothetical protein CAMRE0001_0947 [Campylobacter rectus RM3267]